MSPYQPTEPATALTHKTGVEARRCP